MLGGAGRYIGLLAASVMVPFYVCLILGVVFFAYFWTFLLVSFLLTPIFLMGVQTYKHSIFAGCRALGLTLQKDGKKDEFDYITFDGYHDYGKGGDATWHRYSVKNKLNGQRYLLMMQEELERIAYEADEIFAGAWIETLPTSYIVGVQVGRYTRHISPYEREERSFFARHILRKGDPPTSEEIPLVQVYSTNETGQRILLNRFDTKGMNALSKEQLEALKADFEFVDSAKTRTELGTVKESLDSAEQILKAKGGCEIQFRSPKPQEEGMAMREVLIIVGAVAASIVALVVILKLLGAF